jgi:hypothetical protein
MIKITLIGFEQATLTNDIANLIADAGHKVIIINPDSFLNNSFIDSQTIDNNKIGSANRKRIADIGVKYNALSQQKKDQLIEYAKEKAGVELNEQGNFKVNTENNLKKLLFAMDERDYRSDIYEENRLANSIRVV